MFLENSTFLQRIQSFCANLVICAVSEQNIKRLFNIELQLLGSFPSTHNKQWYEVKYAVKNGVMYVQNTPQQLAFNFMTDATLAEIGQQIKEKLQNNNIDF